MAVFTIPIDPTVADNVFEITLDDVSFRLRFTLNSRDGAYYMDVLDPDDVILRAGIKVISDWDLVRLWQGLERPAGPMITVATGSVGAEDPPVLGVFGDEVILTYIGDS